MAVRIAPQASVHPNAELEDDVEIGPFCVIGPKVTIGRGTRLENNVTIMGRVRIGEGNHIFPGVVIGGPPQDLSYTGADTQVVIGHHNIIRECVTINRGSEKEDGITSIGDHNYLMACCHVAHDCKLGSHIVIANASLLGGHVHVHDYAGISGGVAVHHFATIGSYCFIGGVSAVRHDAPPYMLCEGNPARPRCVNVVGLKRHNFSSETIACLTEAYRLLFRTKVGVENARQILCSKGLLVPAVNHLLAFMEGLSLGRHGRSRDRRQAA